MVTNGFLATPKKMRPGENPSRVTLTGEVNTMEGLWRSMCGIYTSGTIYEPLQKVIHVQMLKVARRAKICNSL